MFSLVHSSNKQGQFLTKTTILRFVISKCRDPRALPEGFLPEGFLPEGALPEGALPELRHL